MSVTAGTGLYQPFQCRICQSRFTRHENLKRHALLHSREAVLACDFCQATFSRADLRNRHLKRKHPEQAGPRKGQPGESQRGSLSPESHVEPAEQLLDSGWDGQDVMDLQTLLNAGPAISHSPDFTGFNAAYQDGWMPSAAQITAGCELFFAHVAHFVPFLHQPTFNASQTPLHLLLSMLSLAFQYGDDPDSEHPGPDLSSRCFHRARLLLANNPPDTITTVQSYLLLQICAMMYLCGAHSAHALTMHSSMISLARSTGFMHPTPLEPSTTTDLDTLWHAFITAESHKRTLFAVHQIDALWYQFLSVPRSISHLEIKHDLPCPLHHWAACSAAEWAHRQLIQSHRPASAATLQYADAVRRFLSQDPSDLPSESQSLFDPYGAINITQFLISSAREISGWSTMTGMLSIDRFGALRSSLASLHPFIGPTQPDKEQNPASSLPLATWQTAMIELQIWSPAHTSGVIESSLDAVLSHSTTHFSPAPEILCDGITAGTVQPHVDWFLLYLEDTVDVRGEAPWVALYAYKAFLIALQLVRGRVEGAMRVVGVGDGDVEGAMRWARGVFGRRERWVLGGLIGGCLRELQV